MASFKPEARSHHDFSRILGYVHDLDGTATVRHGVYSPEVLDAFKEAHKKRLVQIPATGQAFYQANAALTNCMFAAGFIFSDGGLAVSDVVINPDQTISFYEVAKHYYSAELATQAITAVREEMKRQHPQYAANLRFAVDIDETKSGGPLSGYSLLEAGFQLGWDTPQQISSSGLFQRASDLRGDVAKILVNRPIHMPVEDFRTLLEAIPPELGTVFSSHSHGATLSPPGVTKDTGVNALTQYLDIDPKLLIRYGDGLNDAPLAKTGWLFAMNNGYPELKAIAKASGGGVIGSVRNNGLARHLTKVIQHIR